MANTRYIKHKFFLNEKLADLPATTRLLFIGLWTIADREGRLDDRPRKIKAELFPYENIDIIEGLGALAQDNFIVRYQIDELPYIEIVNFKKHQNPHVRERASTIPPPPVPGLAPSKAMPFPGKGIALDEPFTSTSQLGIGNDIWGIGNGETNPGAASGQSPAPPPTQPDVEYFTTSEVEKKASPPVPPAPAPKPEPETPEISEIVEYLNELCGTAFSAKTKQTRALITARMKAGATQDDFRLIIAHKAREWLNDPKMRAYLRPETLFCEKHFEGYLNAANLAILSPLTTLLNQPTVTTTTAKNGKSAFTFNLAETLADGADLVAEYRAKRAAGIQF